MRLTIECYLPDDLISRLAKHEPWETPFVGASVAAKSFAPIQISGKSIYETEYGNARERCHLIVFQRNKPQIRFVKDCFIDLFLLEIKLDLDGALHMSSFIKFWNFKPRNNPLESNWIVHEIIVETS